MPRPCSICIHPQRSEVDAALVEGHDTFRGLAARFGTSATAMCRHKKEHLPSELVKAQQVQEMVQADDLLGQVQELQRRTITILARAELAGDLRTALQAVREARGNLELLAKLVAAALLSTHRGSGSADEDDGKGISAEEFIAEIIRLVGEPEIGPPPTDDQLPPAFRSRKE